MKKYKEFEMEIYELLGVKTFRKMVFMLRDAFIVLSPFNILNKLSIEDIKEKREKAYHIASNYNLGKVRSVKDVEKYKNKIYLNSAIHISGLLVCLPGFFRTINGISSMSFSIINLICILINSYCIMLQRYNCIRINQLIERMKVREEKQKNNLKKELVKSDSLLLEHTYKIVDSKEKNKETKITIEELIDKADIEKLKLYRDYFTQFQDVNQKIHEDDNYSIYDEVYLTMPMEDCKTLKLELKRNKNNGANC